jgi:hypothetical protein
MYLGSEARSAFLEKEVEFISMPRWASGSNRRTKNEAEEDYFAFRVRELAHREGIRPA